jgi:hypothetical protein
LTTLDHFHPHPSPAFLRVKWEKRKAIQATLSAEVKHHMVWCVTQVARSVVFSVVIPGRPRPLPDKKIRDIRFFFAITTVMEMAQVWDSLLKSRAKTGLRCGKVSGSVSAAVSQ